jgi:hypothetical protein
MYFSRFRLARGLRTTHAIFINLTFFSASTARLSPGKQLSTFRAQATHKKSSIHACKLAQACRASHQIQKVNGVSLGRR